MTTRRQFIQTTMAAGLAVSLAGTALSKQPDMKPAAGSKKLRILILGGTGFIGPAIIRAAQKNGHTVSTFTRGKTRPGLFRDDEVEKLYGNRDPKKSSESVKDSEGAEKTWEGLKALEGKKWDVVIDDSGMYPRHVKASAELLAPNVNHYIYISSVSAYDMPFTADDETAKLTSLRIPDEEKMGGQYENYGGLKVLCERAAEEACKGKTTVVRPGFIVGPDDYSGRFTYWPVRVDQGGEVLAPGNPSDPVQLIDVRDLADWLVKLAEDRTIGAFDALGPMPGELTMGKLLEGCSRATKTPHTYTWVPASFIEENGVPVAIWAPNEGETKGFHTRNVSRAMKAGLKFRPIGETCRDTLEWWKTVPEGDRRKILTGPAAPPPAQKLDLAAEKAVLEKWAKAGSTPKLPDSPKPADK